MIRKDRLFRCLCALVFIALRVDSHPLVPSSPPIDCKNTDQKELLKAENSLNITISILRLLRELNSESTEETKQEIILRNSGFQPNKKIAPLELTTIGALLPTSCADLYKIGHLKNGIYKIYPRWESSNSGYLVFCDMSTESGGWTVLQRRMQTNKQENFTRPWKDYKEGFGNLETEFWLGNDKIHLLTNEDRVLLRLEIEDWDGQKRFAHYKGFRVASEEDSYKMSYKEYFDSTAVGDQLKAHMNLPFATFDKDNTQKVAAKLSGGFWWPNIADTSILVNLNGVFYPKGKHLNNKNGIFWHSLKGRTYSMKRIEMKIRSEFFSTRDHPLEPL